MKDEAGVHATTGSRAEAVRAAVAASVAPSSIAFAVADERVEYSLEFWQLSDVVVSRAGGSAVRMRRTATHVRRSAPEAVHFGILLAGEARYDQAGASCSSRPGDVRLVDLTQPFGFTMRDHSVHATVGIELTQLAVPVDVVRRAAPRLASSPLYPLFAAHLAGLLPIVAQLAGTPGGSMAAASTIELARAVLTTVGREPGQDVSPPELLVARVEAFVRAHLSTQDLTAERIAAAHAVSVRHLYNVWSARHEDTLFEWVMRERLAGAHQELLAGPDVTVATVARRWGFADASHFTRRFRQAYGVSPRECRPATD